MNIPMKKIGVMALLCCVAIALRAQQPALKTLVYTDGFALKLIGQAFPISNSYHRIDTTLHRDFPAGIKRLLTHSTGLVLSFRTNSPRIAAKWCVPDTKPYAANMNAIVNKGLDLYIRRNGVWEFAGVGRPTAGCNEAVLVKDMEAGEKECLLYLPAYDEVKSLSLGIDSGYQVAAGNDPFAAKRVVVYGSSITQGAAASRPGMVYPARLSRDLGVNFINLGLSGSGKMEKAVADMVASIQADAFVLDCFANPSPEQITERTNYIVKAIRAEHPQAPIILIQSVVRENGNFDQGVKRYVQRQNDNAMTEYQKLVNEGVKNLYLIPAVDLLGKDHEGTTDGTHPNDIGFDRMLQVIRPEMIRILSLKHIK